MVAVSARLVARRSCMQRHATSALLDVLELASPRLDRRLDRGSAFARGRVRGASICPPNGLLEYVAAEHANRTKRHGAARGKPDRDEVERLLAVFVKTAGARAADSIDSFANALYVQGLLSAEGLKDFLTYHALTIGALDAASDRGAARYELMSLVGHGAMGEVYLGRDPSLKRTVAVKRVHADLASDPLLLQRFFNEAQVTAQLDHPAIVPVYGLERDEKGGLSYAMKFVRGHTLSQYLEEARQQIALRGTPDASHSLKARVETFIPVLNALAYAHRRGVVHRDLKPENIMVGSFGEVLVMDWGIARVGRERGGWTRARARARLWARARVVGAGARVRVRVRAWARAWAWARARARGAGAGAGLGLSTNQKLTMAGTVLGTPAFMSPEQAAGLEVDASSDQYSLGLILQEIITLKPAMSAETMPVMFARALRGIREPMIEGVEPIARELRAIVGRATAPKRVPIATRRSRRWPKTCGASCAMSRSRPIPTAGCAS